MIITVLINDGGIRGSMTVPPNPRHSVSGGCHNGGHIDEEEEDEANPAKDRGDQVSPGEEREISRTLLGRTEAP